MFFHLIIRNKYLKEKVKKKLEKVFINFEIIRIKRLDYWFYFL